ncbi:Hypothetical_protein [Hexamita inflata]|uniref:Hypothetical_protein n=1 Tax=Hexamita inflata TaxID=28002 RepID=A0AA86UBU9_9EUKA|nr:Hypothetical protein HINF_LOCUS23703 [Hexamita inflata]
MIEKRTQQRQEQKDTQNAKNLILTQNKLQQSRLKCSDLEQQISDKDIQLQETTNKYITAMKTINETSQNYIDMQLKINQLAKELKEQQELNKQQQKLLLRAKNMDHILKYVDNQQIQDLFFDINNIGLEVDPGFDIKNYFQSKGQAKVFYSKLIKLLEKQKLTRIKNRGRRNKIIRRQRNELNVIIILNIFHITYGCNQYLQKLLELHSLHLH